MTPAIGHEIFAVSNSLAASIIVKATIVISIALIAAYFARHNRASVRHAILAAGFAVLLVLPIAAIIAPPLHIALPIAQGSSTISTNSAQSFDETTLAPGTATNAPSTAKSEATSSSLFDLLFIAWAFGAVVFLAPVIIGLWQIRSLRRTALPWSHGTSVASTLANELKINRRIQALLHEAAPGPMTCGIFHPAVVFPVEAENWNDADLDRAIAHELEHVRRADWLTHFLARIVCAAYWFHPFVWIAWRQLTLEAERACDDAVLARSEATAYAEQLVALARQLTAVHKSPLLAMASRSDLSSRISAVLDTRRARGRVGIFVIAFACGLAALAVATLSPARLVAAPSRGYGQQSSRAPLPSFEVASIKRDPSGCGGCQILLDGGDPGRYTSKNVTAKWLIELAYNIKDFQLSGGPSWVNSEGFDIDAKIDDATANQIRHLSHDDQEARKALMLESLLADRFNLKITRGAKDMPGYAVVVAKDGSKITEVPPPPPPGTSPTRALPRARGADGLLPLLPGERDISGSRNGVLTIRGSAVPLSQLASMLSEVLGQPVVDETGMKRTYDFKLQYTPETGFGGRPLPPTVQAMKAGNAPSLFSAMQEQLGLRLESTKVPVETIVIDHINEPSEN